MKKLRIAMIGAGIGRGQSWMSTLKKLSNLSELYDFCSLCETIEERAKENAERWGVKPYTNLVTMLEEEKLDVVLNCIHSDGNSMVTALAAKHGVNVITEIPIAPTLPIADFMIETTKRHGVKLEVTEQVYLWAREQLKKKIIDSGLLGEITHARLWYPTGNYHGFNAVRMLLSSEAKRVLGYAGEVAVPPYTGYTGELITSEQWESAVIEFENGVVCLFEMTPPGQKRSGLWEIEGGEGRLVGNELQIGDEQFPFQYEYTEVEGERVLEHVRVDTDTPIVFQNPFLRYRASDNDEVARMQLLCGFHKAVTEDMEPEYGALNARRDQELEIAVRSSALKGSVWIDLPLKEVTEIEKRMHEEYRKLYGHDPGEVEALATVAFSRGGVRWTVAGWL